MTTVSAEIAALRYLHQPADSFWKWTDDGGAIQWFNGPTIVFTAELLVILRQQHAAGTRGLPPLGATILLVAATRQNWTDTNQAKLSEFANCNSISEYLPRVLEGLDKIHLLAADVRTSLEAKQWIAEFMFQRSARTAVETAREVLRILGDVEETFWVNDGHAWADQSKGTLLSSINELEYGIERVTSDKLRMLRETGIEEIPVAPEEQIEFPEYASIKSLVSDLHADKELYGVARAAQQLMSVMSLPRPLVRDDQVEQGGFSDIANRGALDRLLLSELAYDDLTLAVRVAVNEAMYLRRESPPNNSQRRRVFLLDSGLRMWGVPRFLGTSVAVALASQLQSEKDQDTEVFTAFSASGPRLEEVNLSQRKGIATHLNSLHPELDPSGSFPKLVESLDSFEEESEVVVITSPEALADVEFRDSVAKLAQQTQGTSFVVTVTREGETRLHEMTRSGCKPLQRIQFDLEKVFSNPPISKAQPARKLPAILGIKEFPLLLSYHYKSDSRVWGIGNDMMLAITNDSRLMLSFGSKHGAIQLMEYIKPANHWWSSREAIDSVWYSIIGNLQKNDFRLLHFNQDDLSVEETPLQLNQAPVAFCQHAENIFFIGQTYVSMIDKTTGMTSLNRLELGDKIYKRGRYFVSGSSLLEKRYALGNQGLAPTFELLPPGPVELDSDNCTMFDSNAVEGTVGFFESGFLYFWSQSKAIKIQNWTENQMWIDDICPSGNEIIFRSHASRLKTKIEVKTGTLTKPPGYLHNFHQLQVQKLVGQHQLRTKFLSIAVHDGEFLSLVTRNQSRIVIKLFNENIHLVPVAHRGIQHSKIRFQKVRSGASIGFRLQMAKWNDGSQAWIDSRGLLHLKSSDEEIPELTMVLTDQASGGWLSNGRVWGNRFFLRQSNPVHATNKYVMDIITKFTTTIASRC